jgi:phosphotransferase system IIA component
MGLSVLVALALAAWLGSPLLAQTGTQEGQQATQQAKGTIQNIVADQHQFTLKDPQGRERIFHVARNARVQINGKQAQLAELQKGQEVTLTYQQVLTEIRAGRDEAKTEPQKQQGQTVRGQIQRVMADQRQLSLKDQNGKEHVFQISQNARVQLNGRNASLNDLQQGQELAATRQMVANEIRAGNQN